MEITLENIVNKTMLVEINALNGNHEFMEKKQLFGKIIHATRTGIAFRKLDDYMIHSLPANLDGISEADPEGYILDATGEEVHPDLITAWNIIMT